MRGGLISVVLTAALGGCATMPDFIGDTETYGTNPNMPVGASINMQRVRGKEASVEPLLPEPGNVWPTDIQKTPTLQELEKEGGGTAPAAPPADLTPFMPGHTQPRPAPGSDGFGGAPVSSAAPAVTGPGHVAQSRVRSARQAPATVATPGAPSPVTSDGAGYKSIATPEGNAILVPNGNGTSTLIKPNGGIETVPTPK